MISEQQAQQFHDDGYLVLEAVLTAEELDTLNGAIDAVRDSFSEDRHQTVFTTRDRDSGRDEVFFRSAETVEYFLEEDALDDSGALTRPLGLAINKMGHALHDHVPAIRALARDPRIGNALGALGQANPQLWQSMVIFKQPGIGGAVRWHQDASYLHTRPATVIGVWIALEAANQENGCLLVAPGAHRSALRERYRVDWTAREGRLETLDTAPWPADETAHAVEVPAGSVVFFGDHLPHASSSNRSPRSRRALTLHYADAASQWSEDNWLQRPGLGPFTIR